MFVLFRPNYDRSVLLDSVKLLDLASEGAQPVIELSTDFLGLAPGALPVSHCRNM